MLTRDEKKVYEYIRGQLERGESVSYREIEAAMGYGSVSTAAARVKSLEAKGFLTRDSGRSRSIRLTAKADAPKRTVCVPLIDMARFNSAKPVLAPENIVNDLELPTLGRSLDPASFFCVTVRGGAFEPDFRDGDVIAVAKAQTASDGAFYVEISENRLKITRGDGGGLIIGRIIAVIRWF